MQKKYDIAIIGAGINGTMLAYKLARYRLSVALIEQAHDVAEGISKANSGVLHAGFNVPTGTLKAELNLKGLKQYPKILRRLKVPFKRCKKLVIAKDDQQKNELLRLLNQGKKNGCTGLKIVGHEKIKKYGVQLAGKWALYSPKTAIVSPYQLSIALAESAKQSGVSIFLASEVTAIDQNLTLTINGEDKIECGMVINSAGINADSVATLLGPHPYKVHPCRGEYFVIDKKSYDQLDMAIYPVPLKDGRSLGVHLTPTMDGNILIGPSAEYQESKKNVGNSKEVMTLLKTEAYELLPALEKYPLIKNYSGLRPKLSPNGFSDFVIKPANQNHKMINLLGIESPGLTAAPAIADYIITHFISKHFQMRKKFFTNRPLRPMVSIRSLAYLKRKKLIRQNKNFGEIVCRCEQISLAEIEAALSNPLGSKTLGTIKKRTRATMGRCQGSYCLSKISHIMSKEMDVTDICKDGNASSLFEGERS